jgi:hypothetical protein
MSAVVDINAPLPYDPTSWSVDTACRQALKRYDAAHPPQLMDEAEGESMIASVIYQPEMAPEDFTADAPGFLGTPPGWRPAPSIRLVQRPYRTRRDLTAANLLGRAVEAARDGDPILLERLPVSRTVVDKYLKLRGTGREVSWMLPDVLGHLLSVHKLRPDHVALAVLIIAAEIGKAVLLAETTAPRGDAKVAA